MENNLDNVEKDNNSVQEKLKNPACFRALCSLISFSLIASSYSIYLNVVTGRKLDEIGKKLNGIDKKLDGIDKKLDIVNDKLDNILVSLENQSQNIANELNNPTQKYPLGQERFKDNTIIKEENITIAGSYGDTILVNDNASIYALPDLATPLTPYYQNSDMQRVIGGAIMMDENQNSYVAMTEEDMADLTSKGYTVYGYLALNEYSQNAYDYEGVYLAGDVTVLDKNIYQTRSLHR